MLIPKENRKLLRDVKLIKEKRCSKIKLQTCAEVSKQRGYIPREYASFKTIYLEALMATLVVDAYEGQDVAIFYDPGEYFNAYITEDKDVRIKL